MCRLLLANKQSWNEVDTLLRTKGKGGIVAQLDHLKKECGGHGNGFILLKDNKIKTFKKGVSLTNQQIVDIAGISDWDYIIYHTRIKSCGVIEDNNCHPFVSGQNALAMNGTEAEMTDIAKALGKTDTEIIFDIIKDKPIDDKIKVLLACSSVFIGVHEGIPLIVNAYGDLERINNKEFWASSFMSDISEAEFCMRMRCGYVFRGDTKRELLLESRMSKYERSYYREDYTDVWNYEYKQFDDGYVAGSMLAERWFFEGQPMTKKRFKKEMKSYCEDEEFEFGFETGYSDKLSELRGEYKNA